MKYILSIIFVFISLLAYSQQDTIFVRYNIADYNKPLSYKTDTILFTERGFDIDRDLLIGTMVLPWTYNQINAKGYGLNLENVTLDPCENSEEAYFMERDEIISVIETENELNISIKIAANCCHSFLCDVDVIDEKTINLIMHGYGAYCACLCCFGLTFHFDIIKDSEYLEYEKLKDIIINGQEKTRKKIR